MIIKNSIIYAVTILMKGILGFAVIAAFTRIMPVAEYGDYAVIIAILGFADVFGFMWLRQALLRHMTDEIQIEDSSNLSNTLLIYAFVMTVLALAAWSFSGILSLLIITEGVSNFVIVLARIRLKLKLFAFTNILKPLVALSLGAALLMSGMGVGGALLAIVAGNALVAVIGFLVLQDFKTLDRRTISKPQIKAILIFGLPMVATLSMQTAIQATDRLLLDGIIGGDITGLYAAAQDVPTKILIMLTSALHMAIYPLAVKAMDNGGKQACQDQLSKNAAMIWGILCPAALGLIILSKPMAELFLGEGFRDFAALHIPIFVVITMLNALTQYYFLLGSNMAKQTTRLIIPFALALITNLIIGLLLIPSIAQWGAIAGSACAYLILMTAVILQSRKPFKMPIPWTPIRQITIAALTMAVVIGTMNMGDGILILAVKIPVGVFVYGLCLYILNPMNIREIIKARP